MCFELVKCISKYSFLIEKAKILAVKVKYGHHKYVTEK